MNSIYFVTRVTKYRENLTPLLKSIAQTKAKKLVVHVLNKDLKYWVEKHYDNNQFQVQITVFINYPQKTPADALMLVHVPPLISFEEVDFDNLIKNCKKNQNSALFGKIVVEKGDIFSNSMLLLAFFLQWISHLFSRWFRSQDNLMMHTQHKWISYKSFKLENLRQNRSKMQFSNSIEVKIPNFEWYKQNVLNFGKFSRFIVFPIIWIIYGTTLWNVVSILITNTLSFQLGIYPLLIPGVALWYHIIVLIILCLWRNQDKRVVIPSFLFIIYNMLVVFATENNTQTIILGSIPLIMMPVMTLPIQMTLCCLFILFVFLLTYYNITVQNRILLIMLQPVVLFLFPVYLII